MCKKTLKLQAAIVSMELFVLNEIINYKLIIDILIVQKESKL